METTTSIIESTLQYSDGNMRLQGFLARPPSKADSQPAVLVAPEWWGLNLYAKSRARQLAAMGYIALVVDMYGNGAVTDDSETAAALASTTRTGALARRRIIKAFEALSGQPGVDSNRVAAVGFCFGGSVVLELARSGADVRSVTCFHGSLATPLPATAEALKASILVLNGADDPFISQQEILGFEAEMRAAQADWQLVSLGGAVHSFSNPDADRANMTGVSYHCLSERRAWRLFEHFLQETLLHPVLSDRADP
jgi:dienelactone hydrolase